MEEFRLLHIIYMYPSIWKYIGQLAIFFIYDLIEDDKAKNRIQQLVKRLKTEEGCLKHDISELLAEYHRLLNTTFKSEEIASFLTLSFLAMVKNYQQQILEYPSYLSASEAEYAYWSYHISESQHYYSTELQYWLEENQFTVSSDLMEILFPFINGEKETPFNKIIIGIIKQNLLNKRQFAEAISPDSDQLDSYIKKVQRWTTSKSVPNFKDVKMDLSKFLSKYPKNGMREGILISLYLSIALSKLYKEFLTPVMAQEIREIKTHQFSQGIKKVYNEQEQQAMEYWSELQKPIYDLLKEIKYGKESSANLRKKVTLLTDGKASLITKYHAECFVYFLNARILYMEKKYEEAKLLYVQAYDNGKYRMGREIKVVIYELLYCCRKTDDKKLFEKVHDWLSFIIEQKFEELLSFEQKPLDEVWEYFNKDSMNFVFINHKTGKMYS